MRPGALAFAVALLLGSPALAEDPPEAAPASPSPRGETPAEKPDCDGRNPFYCGVVVQNQEGPDDDEDAGGPRTLRPPGGCEGRNPLYCQEVVPEAGAEAEEEAAPRREGANAESRNTRRNQNQNPNRNPNRNPRRNRRAAQ